MKRPFPQVFLLIFLAALLAVPTLLVGRSATPSAPDAAASLERFGFFFEEVSERSGIRFTHQAPKLDPQLDHIMPQVAVLGASVAVTDFDNDGWNDLYVTNSGEGSLNALYRNRGNGTFEDVAGAMGVADVNREGTGVSMGSVWGDFDNDGFEDFFLYKWGRSELFRNDAGRGFTRVTRQTGLPAWANINGATWLDYDRDGRLDLFFGGSYSENIDLWHLTHTRIMPESYEYAQNGGRKYLLRGRGDGSFEDASDLLGPDTRRWMMAAAAADLRGTGYPDLFVANDYGVDEVFFNEEGKGFRPAGEATNVGFAPKSGMNVAFGDVFNQGLLSVYVSNISEPGVLLQGNNLWVPKPGSNGEALAFTNMAAALQVEEGGWSYGAQFGDLNNDGNLDLFVTNGYVSADNRESYWYDFSKIAGGNRAIISDAKHWPPMKGRSLSGHQQKRVWMNDGTGRFQEVSYPAGVRERYDGRAVALVDLWNRGVLDVVVAHQRGPLLVYRNTVAPDHAWIGFALEGSRSNRSAIGARVELYWNGQRQVQEVSGGSGFSAQNQRRLHFGLGSDPEIEKAVIRWPSGAVQTLDAPEAGIVHTIREPHADDRADA